jgi:sulfonate transport system permease protein
MSSADPLSLRLRSRTAEHTRQGAVSTAPGTRLLADGEVANVAARSSRLEADRLPNDVGSQRTRGVADQVTDGADPQRTVPQTGRATDSVSPQRTVGLAERATDGVGPRRAVPVAGRRPAAVGGRRLVVPTFARRALGPIILLGAWQLAASLGLVSPKVFSSPLAVASAAAQLLSTGALQHHLLVSLQRVTIGLLIGVSTGLALASISGLWTLGEELVDSSVQMLRTLPFLALVPLFILWFGIGETPKIALVALGTTFPIYLNTYAGIRNVDAKLVEAARLFGVGRWGLLRDVVLPGALPQVLVGLRYALGTAWLSLAVAEQINATAGIGYLITDARDFLRTDVILVALVVYSLLGLTADLLVRMLERTMLVWRRSFSGA